MDDEDVMPQDAELRNSPKAPAGADQGVLGVTAGDGFCYWNVQAAKGNEGKHCHWHPFPSSLDSLAPGAAIG